MKPLENSLGSGHQNVFIRACTVLTISMAREPSIQTTGLFSSFFSYGYSE